MDPSLNPFISWLLIKQIAGKVEKTVREGNGNQKDPNKLTIKHECHPLFLFNKKNLSVFGSSSVGEFYARTYLCENPSGTHLWYMKWGGLEVFGPKLIISPF